MKKLTISLLLATLLFSCKPTQIKETEKEVQSKDSTNTTVINKEVLDKILFQIDNIKSVNPECDSLINLYREQLAKGLYASKQSGDNSYELKYNELTKQLEFIAKMGETKSITIHTNEIHTIEKTKDVPVNFMHWWETAFMRLGQLALVVVVGWVVFKIK